MSGRYFRVVGLFLATALLMACSKGELPQTPASVVDSATPDRYLLFLNRQARLPAGDYTLVVAPASAGVSGPFSVEIERNDGSAVVTQNGQWTNARGPLAEPLQSCDAAPANACFDLAMQFATGVSIRLTSSLDGLMYLVDDSNGAIVATQNELNTGGIESLVFVPSALDDDAFTRAYYAAIDPNNARDTLQKYQQLHGFDTHGADVHVTFRDSKDLGYGRDMYMRSYPNTECGGQVTAFYVRNFALEIIDGLAYGAVNLQAALAEDLRHHFGSNAIEFSRGLLSVDGKCSDQPFARFFTFRSDYSSPGAPHPRLTRIDLDKRGAKAMPQPCISCHGGKILPVDRFGRMVVAHANDSERQIGDTKARLQAFEVDTFEFSTTPGHSRADLEEGLRRLNSAVFCTYPGSQGHPACDDFGGGLPAQTDDGEWNGDFAREVMLGWYGGALQTAGSAFSDAFVPAGWTPSPGTVPEGADTLFRKVVGPNCFVCHGKRGNALGRDLNDAGNGKELDFSTYEKFISYAEEIRLLVFEEGRMPLGLLNYNNFWGDPEKAELLASFIAPRLDEEFIERHTDAAGNIVKPGQVVARAGPDRVTRPNAEITLNGHGSMFADRFSWSVTAQPANSNVNLTRPQQGMTGFSADLDGVYEITLTAASSLNAGQHRDSLVVKVDSSLAKAPSELDFFTDIVPVLNSCATQCHSAGGGDQTAIGVPVWWVEDASQPLGVPASISDSPALGFYEQVRARIDFERIERSPLLLKPSGIHHYGGRRDLENFNISLDLGAGGRASYEMFVNWISEGAACGGDALQCP